MPCKPDGPTDLILNWYQKNKRDLPWRNTQDAYAIWVSEIMLQQTRVDTVIPYYKQFMSRFPDAAALAAASEDEVLPAWKGLGYYSRARNLHRAARILIDKYGGKFPRILKEALLLPGIGEYSAGAVLSIAYDLPVPAVDGNVLRVISRLNGLRQDIARNTTRKTVAQIVAGIMPADRAGDFTQALMELGALICIPLSPRCDACPVSSLCCAFRDGSQGEIPVKTGQKAALEISVHAALIRKGGRILMEHRQDQSLLSRMWGLPVLLDPPEDMSEIPAVFMQKYGLALLPGPCLGQCRHVFSHQIWNIRVYSHILHTKGADVIRGTGNTLRWVTREETEGLAIPAAFQKMLALTAGQDG